MEDLDANIVALVEALNRFEGITTVGSCGGHPNHTPIVQRPEGEWNIAFRVDHSEPGWLALEFIAWWVHDHRRESLRLRPFAAPPYLNTPGQCLTFSLEGNGEDPLEAARWLDEMRQQHYTGPSQPPPSNVVSLPDEYFARWAQAEQAKYVCAICAHCEVISVVERPNAAPRVRRVRCRKTGAQFGRKTAEAKRCAHWWPPEEWLAQVRAETGGDD